MPGKAKLDAVYVPSDDIVVREIEAEIIIVPLIAGIGDAEGDLFTLNETGREFWKFMDGKMTLKQIVKTLAEKYDARQDKIGKDISGLAAELLKRRIICEKKQS